VRILGSPVGINEALNCLISFPQMRLQKHGEIPLLYLQSYFTGRTHGSRTDSNQVISILSFSSNLLALPSMSCIILFSWLSS